MYTNEPILHYNSSTGVGLDIEYHPEEILESSNPDLDFYPGLLDVFIPYDGSNPNIGGDITHWQLYIVWSKYSVTQQQRILSDNTLLLLSPDEEVISIDISEREKTINEDGVSYFGMWLEVIFKNSKSKEEFAINCLLEPYYKESRSSKNNHLH